MFKVTYNKSDETIYSSVSEASWGISKALKEQVPFKELVTLKNTGKCTFESSSGIVVSIERSEGIV